MKSAWRTKRAFSTWQGSRFETYRPAFNTISNSAAPASVAFTLQCP